MRTKLTLFFLFFCLTIFAQKIKVACIGNSITYGYTIENRDKDSYPAQLQALLGEGYDVQNYGNCGKTAQNDADDPYTKCPEYQQAKDFLPQIAVIKLGTNDSKPQNWVGVERFIKDLEDLAVEYENLPSKPKIIICLPAKAYKVAWSIRDEVIQQQLPAIKKLAKKHHWQLINLYKKTSGKAELFPDGIHPNAKGAGIIAAEVKKAVLKVKK
ncbi:MAG: GDSL-type esterase/lipase family protein [Bacteroidaceae bacterium]|nr:GDSL-type esterase/lipase family protein [Bacteroidaceae bacterium]